MKGERKNRYIFLGKKTFEVKNYSQLNNSRYSIVWDRQTLIAHEVTVSPLSWYRSIFTNFTLMFIVFTNINKKNLKLHKVPNSRYYLSE